MAASEAGLVEAAPAKVNLTLHVTGRRPDGYHLIDSLVVFTGMGDSVAVAPAERLTLAVKGPEAAGLADEADNLVLRAARLMAPGRGAALRLTKRLPVASGIGGGSADAAAALRALARLWGCPLPPPEQVLALGADVPACLMAQPLRMSGIGERLTPVDALPPCALVLVNPRVAVPTGAVFAALERRDNPAMSDVLPRWRDAAELAGWLGEQRNDLQAPALGIAPAIGAVLAALRSAGALHAGMSGSGATCFGLFADLAAARAAAEALERAEPGWWIAATGPAV